ncbi:uncharacterized protein VTP21DRAFT_7202 [Calcarisporiella thermophila]|uniref:uncharacterized protein n=1 Tax=Calcarisporiella thermophila TaxID=911321 RepID=UPI003743DFA3
MHVWALFGPISGNAVFARPAYFLQPKHIRANLRDGLARVCLQQPRPKAQRLKLDPPRLYCRYRVSWPSLSHTFRWKRAPVRCIDWHK